MQYIPRPKTTYDRFTAAFSAGSKALGKELISQKEQQKQNSFLKQLNPDIDWEGATPEMRQKGFELVMGQQQKRKQQEEVDLQDNQRSEAIRERWGDETADLYNAASEGGKTAIINYLIDKESRGDFGAGLDEKRSAAGVPVSDIQAEENQRQSPQKAPTKSIDYDKGLTPAERTRRQDARYKTNLPLYQESIAKSQAAESERDNLNILEELSPQISGLQRLNINPQSGDLFLPALASPEAQRYVKTINDFTRNAKDSYGARVTNFDLVQFMKRLPTLANSEEGRRQIIKQLKIINDLNLAQQKELQTVFDEHGGIRNIDYDKAESLAEKRLIHKNKELRDKFNSINSKTNSEYRDQVEEKRKLLRKDHVLVRFNNGQIAGIPKDKLKDFIDDGAGEKL